MVKIKAYLIGPLVLFLGFFLFLILSSEKAETPQADSWGLLEGGCTSIMVGRDASADGSTMTTHSCDCAVCDFTWRHVPAQDHPRGATRKIRAISQYEAWDPQKGLKWDLVNTEKLTRLEIPQVPHTYAYHHGMFGVINEHQLAIGESSVGCRAEMRNPAGLMNLTELSLIAMERCQTAREAIKLMGSLGETYGYGLDSGEMLSVADPREVWIFEIMPVGPLWTPESGKPGALWCAQRIPDDEIAVCPNENQIGEIDLDDTDYFMASPNVISYAVEKGWYDPKSGQPFNWKKTYSPWIKSYENHRLWRAFDLLAPSLNLDPKTPNDEFPFSVKPDQKVTVADIMRIHRDHYEGTIYDCTDKLVSGPYHNPISNNPYVFELDGETYGFNRPIALGHCEYTTITQSRAGMPDGIGGLVWVALGVTPTSCFVPFYAGITEIPHSFTIGDHWTFNRNSARWAFIYVDFNCIPKYAYAIEDVKKAQAKWEGEALARQTEIEEKAMALYDESPDKAAEFLTGYCLDNAKKVIDAWWKLGDDLLVKHHQGYLYTEDRKQIQVGYPEKWLRLFVEHDRMEPLPKRK